MSCELGEAPGPRPGSECVRCFLYCLSGGDKAEFKQVGLCWVRSMVTQGMTDWTQWNVDQNQSIQDHEHFFRINKKCNQDQTNLRSAASCRKYCHHYCSQLFTVFTLLLLLLQFFIALIVLTIMMITAGSTSIAKAIIPYSCMHDCCYSSSYY